MACNCNSSPCFCLPRCPEECPTVIEKSATNINLAGVGVYDSELSDQFQFRGVQSGDDYIVVTLDNTNHTVVLTINEATIAGGVPDATETVEGKVELATQAETNTGTDDTRAVTPLKLANRTATETRAGVIEIATQAEVTTGTDDVRAITPLKLSTFSDSLFLTRSIADTTALAVATPDFEGQLAVERSGSTMYWGGSGGAGDWNPIFAGTTTVTSAALASNAVTTAKIQSQAVTGPKLSATMDITQTFNFDNGSVINFKTGSVIQDNGVTVTQNSVLITGGTAGDLSSMLISQFLSSANVQTGWVAATGTATRSTFATGSVTLPQLAERVKALIDDLLARNLPSA